MRSKLLTILFLPLIALVPSFWRQARAERLELAVKETRYGVLPLYPKRIIAETITVSPDNRKVACIVQLDEGPEKRPSFQVFLYGGEGKQIFASTKYDLILPESLVFSHDSESFIFVGVRGKKFFLVVNGKERGSYDRVLPPVFIPNSKRIVYAAKAGQKSFFVFQNATESQEEFYGGTRKGKEYDAVGSPVVDQSGRRIAYIAKRGEKFFVVLNEKEGKEYDDVPPDSLVFNSDGSKLAYVAREGENWFVVTDEKESPPCEGVKKDSIVFSPNGKRMAYVKKKGEKQVPVIDGVEGTEFDKVIGVGFSPDSQKAFCIAQRGEKVMLILDGTEVEGNIIVLPVFSPDGQRMAYAASSGGKQFVVIDGVKGKGYDEILPSFAFSPDGKRFIYAAKKGKKFVAVVDGVENKEYDGLKWPSIYSPGRYNGKPLFTPFSPDSKHVAYFAQRDGKWFVVVDGVELKKRYESVSNISFTPDSDLVVCKAKRGGKTVVAVNETEMELEGILRGSGVFFYSPSSFRVLTLGKNMTEVVMGEVVTGIQLFLTEVEIRKR